MKFGKHLERQMRPEWSSYYIDYNGLKDLIKEATREAEQSGGAVAFSPRTTSLSIVRAAKASDAAEERFFTRLEGEVDKIGKFTQRLVDELRAKLRALNPKAAAAAAAKREVTASGSAAGGATPTAGALMAEATGIGEEYLALEKFANLNYMGIHKILKKHDKVRIFLRVSCLRGGASIFSSCCFDRALALAPSLACSPRRRRRCHRSLSPFRSLALRPLRRRCARAHPPLKKNKKTNKTNKTKNKKQKNKN